MRGTEKHGITYENIGNTSVIGFIPGQYPTHTVALRADTDALPLQEASCHPYPSQHPGIMHACGHDVHTACLLGAAIYLKQHQASLPVNIMLIFQAAEEVLPGGSTGNPAKFFFQQSLSGVDHCSTRRTGFTCRKRGIMSGTIHGFRR
ncbi:MAG: M20/M25/M40 family metallo-hydrolase [Odoribacter sp.]